MAAKYDKYSNFIFVCKGKDCKKQGSRKIEKEFEFHLKQKHLHKVTKLIHCECTDRCKEAPVAIVNNQWLGHMDKKSIEEVLEQYISDTE